MSFEGEGLEIGDKLRWLGLRSHHIERLTISNDISNQYVQTLTLRDQKILQSLTSSSSLRYGE